MNSEFMNELETLSEEIEESYFSANSMILYRNNIYDFVDEFDLDKAIIKSLDGSDEIIVNSKNYDECRVVCNDITRLLNKYYIRRTHVANGIYRKQFNCQPEPELPVRRGDGGGGRPRGQRRRYHLPGRRECNVQYERFWVVAAACRPVW